MIPAVGGNNQPHGGNTTNAARGGIGHDIKNSYINNLYMKSGAFMLYLITGILGYAHKIPFVRKILFGLSLWYGKSTWYQIIIRILRIARKILVYLNAAIGVYVVFKAVGFSSDNLAIGIAMMGGEYYMILTNFVKRLFNWFVELFDYKLIPNVPDSPPSKPNLPKWSIPTNFTWTPRPIEEYAFSLRNLYKDALPSDSLPWYRDWNWSTLFWICGGICTAGVIYVGYQSWHEPMYLFNLITGLPSIKHTGATPPANVDEITIGPPTSSSSFGSSLDQKVGSTLLDKGKSVSKGFVSVYKYTIDKLNPFNWVASVSETREQFKVFMDVQNDIARSERSLYPFTDNNPFDSWFKRLRIHYFGESTTELIERLSLKDVAEGAYNEIRVGRGGTETISQASTSRLGETIFSVPNTPTPGSPALPTNTLGLSMPSPYISPFSPVLPAATVEQLNNLSTLSAPSSPVLPSSPSIFASITEWANAEKPTGTAIDEYISSRTSNPSTSGFTPATRTFNTYAQVTKLGIDPLAGIEVY